MKRDVPTDSIVGYCSILILNNCEEDDEDDEDEEDDEVITRRLFILGTR